MFCKWCGGNIASSDTKCRRCGKEVPALSDCGGFYDLVPNAKKPFNDLLEPIAPPENPASPPCKPESARDEKPAQAKKNSGKSLLGLTLLNVVGFVLVIFMLFLIVGKVNQYSTEVNGLGNDLQTISEKIDSLAVTTEPAATEPEATEPTIVLDPVLAEQNVIFTAKINHKDSAHKVDVDLDLGDYNDTAVISYGTDAESNAINAISYTLKDVDAAVVLTVDCSSELRASNLSVSYEIDDVGYGIANAPETCTWQYRFGNDADWEDLPDAFSQLNGIGKTGLSISEASLRELIADNEGELELYCKISRTNKKNGSLTILIEGLRFYENDSVG